MYLWTFPQRFTSWTRLCAGPSPNTYPNKMSMQDCVVIPLCTGSKWAAADQYQPQCQHNRGFSNAEPEDEKGVGSYILVGPVALTRLLSYSFLEAAKSWALEIAIPQKGRYICSTCGHIEVSEKLQTSVISDLIDQRQSQNECYYTRTLLSCSRTCNIFFLAVF